MSVLFEPYNLAGMKLKNRFVRSATTERNAWPEGLFNSEIEEVYEELAAGEVGLIIFGHAYVRPGGEGHPRMTAMDRDEVIPVMRPAVEAAQRRGSKCVAQINHAGSNVMGLDTSGAVGPSALPNPRTKLVPRALTGAEIEEIIENHAQAARRAVEIGFDAVQLHGCHSYLMNQFLSPLSNGREDHWGGTLEKRARYTMEVYRAVRRTVGEGYPVLIKLATGDYLEGGMSEDDFMVVARMLVEEGIDAIECSGGFCGPFYSKIHPHEFMKQDGYFVSPARRLKQELGVPTMLVGGMMDPRRMEQHLEDGDGDLIGLCRSLIREPGFVKRVREGDWSRARCIHCALCSGKSTLDKVYCRQEHPE